MGGGLCHWMGVQGRCTKKAPFSDYRLPAFHSRPRQLTGQHILLLFKRILFFFFFFETVFFSLVICEEIEYIRKPR